MPRIKPVDMNKLDANTAKTVAAVKAKLGALPNIFTTFAQSPVTLNAYLQFSETLAGGQFSAQQREMIAIAVAQENQCGYCLSAHAAIGQGEGLNDEDINQARQGMAMSKQDAAIVAFAIEVVRSNGAVSDDQLAEIRTVSGEDGIVLEIVSNVVLNIMTNYLNRLAGTEIDFPNVDLKAAS